MMFDTDRNGKRKEKNTNMKLTIVVFLLIGVLTFDEFMIAYIH